jgi:hypothetical protein
MNRNEEQKKAGEFSDGSEAESSVTEVELGIPPLENSTDTPFDLSGLRLSQNFAEQVGVKKVLTSVPVRKPDRQWFVRVHPDQAWRMNVAILDLREDRETYLVDPKLLPSLSTEISPVILMTAVNRQDVFFLWPVRLPDASGRHNPWHRSALEAAERAVGRWARVVANMSLGAYDVFEATADYPDPNWPDEGFEGLLGVAFKERIIRSLDHPVLRRLRGEA